MGSEEDIEQQKSTRSEQVSGEMERIYSRKQYIGKRRGFGKCERVKRQI